MDIMDVVYGLFMAVIWTIVLAWRCRKKLKNLGTGIAVAILLLAFIMFFCVACVLAKGHNG